MPPAWIGSSVRSSVASTETGTATSLHELHKQCPTQIEIALKNNSVDTRFGWMYKGHHSTRVPHSQERDSSEAHRARGGVYELLHLFWAESDSTVGGMHWSLDHARFPVRADQYRPHFGNRDGPIGRRHRRRSGDRDKRGDGRGAKFGNGFSGRGQRAQPASWHI